MLSFGSIVSAGPAKWSMFQLFAHAALNTWSYAVKFWRDDSPTKGKTFKTVLLDCEFEELEAI